MGLRCGNRPSRTRKLGVGLSAVGLIGGLLAAPAGAAQGAPEQNRGVISDLKTLTLSAKLVLDPAREAATITSLRSITQLLDATGKALGPRRIDTSVVNEGGPDISSFSCVKQGNGGKHFTAWRPGEIYAQSRIGTEQFLFFPYRHTKGRRIPGGWSTQYEICSTGGADLKDGWRIRQVGTGIALLDATRTYKIGQSWKSGSTPEDYTIGLGFELSGKKSPVTIKGSISQTPTDKLMGSINSPYPTFMDAYARNAVNAWWQDECEGSWNGCQKWEASPNFQGSVAHGLWEFSRSEARSPRVFAVAPYLKYACHGFSCG